ncbi:methyltransferase domain-containing protein [Paenibacillus sp. HJL G12]|uniref:Methyltransferase domain-containing protein n=1 Tax=Paenibacillus dendrobii TaxID=2691084 RepID=A0A7X3IQR8_9BACL|nr:class I SAM-dependent methyltransferase [Paenibacillus dendrobii]MWV47175.1 methyltransferase domain-containing protein [Paenibacillus dendrobii]
MNPNEYKHFYNEVGRLNGWDFSRLNVIVEGEAWNFHDRVTSLCRPGHVLLDIGTGGGEALLAIADSALLLIGIDQSEGMLETAAYNLGRSGKPNVRFLHMNAEQLHFPEAFFNLVTCRHSEFNAKEAARVLTQDGVFLTQQVSEGDKINLKQAFGRGQAWNIKQGILQDRYAAELQNAGFSRVQTFKYDATEYYSSIEDLIFLLKFTPIVPDFGQSDTDFQILHRFIEENQTDQGIRSNSARFMIIAEK